MEGESREELVCAHGVSFYSDPLNACGVRNHSKPSTHTQSLLRVLAREVVFWPAAQG